MKHTWMAIGVCGLSILLAAETPVCKRLIFDLGLKKMGHKPSKATLAKWNEYNKTHIPPKPKKIMKELDLICPEIEPGSADINFILQPEVIPQWNNQEISEALAQVSPAEVESEVEQADTTSQTETFHSAFTTAKVASVPPIQTPEPGSIFLLGTGLLGIAGLLKSRKKI